MDDKYYCSIKDKYLSVDEARGKCNFYVNEYCVGGASRCEILEDSKLESLAEIPQPGDWITADTTAQSLRNLRMMNGE